MMPKDYAKRVFTTRPSKRKRGRTELYLIIIFFILLGVGFWAYKNRLMLTNFSVKSFSNKQPVGAANTLTSSKKTEPPPVQFDFYNQLPSMEIKLPESGGSAPLNVNAKVAEEKKTEAPSLPVAAIQSSGGYIVELGLFKDPGDASEIRLSILLSGVEAELIKIPAKDGKAYRLQKGPFTTLAEAKSVQRKLLNKGISSEVRKDI